METLKVVLGGKYLNQSNEVVHIIDICEDNIKYPFEDSHGRNYDQHGNCDSSSLIKLVSVITK